jgi:hypothetical protein
MFHWLLDIDFFVTIIRTKRENPYSDGSKEMGEEVLVVVLCQIQVQLFGGK